MDLPLNLPSFSPKLRIANGQQQIFDPIRRKFVALTPEEWVRQHYINYLVEYKGFPAGLLAIEHPVDVNSMQQRADIVAFNRKGMALLVVECKSPSITINRETYAQAARYNLTLNANYLVVTNGLSQFCSRINTLTKEFFTLSEIPSYSEIG